ncbi:MAG: hypothetical protein H7Y11_00160, partial [Armatimonadetes bacterium]|nr:hypothetical protein [Anaerolineae bacterium]
MMRRIFPLLACTALTLLFFWKLALTDLILARGDTYTYFYPLWAARDAALRVGQLPLWTPDVLMGAPLLADPQLGTLYPPNWLTISLTPPDAVRISIVLHIVWAALGMFWLARRTVGVGVLGAWVAALAFTFGGYVGAHVEQINQLHGIAWLPWALLVYSAALRRPMRYLPLLAIVFALQVLSGHTQTVFMTGVALTIFGLLSANKTPRTMLGALLGLAVAALLAVVLALPQLYPTLELAGMSNRSGGFNPAQALAFSWNPLLIGRGLLPSYDAQVFGEYVAYPGVAALALALLGALTPNRRCWVWLALVAAGVLLALGL